MIAIYARVSSDEQTERQTIQNQLSFLRDYTKLYSLQVYDEYIDDGVSGTIPVDERVAGERMLDDALERRFDTIIFYRIDRFSRSLRHLLDAYDALKDANITLKSATEPFDTSTPIGVFIMHMLGSMAELERATILERTSQGRDRIVRNGKWSGGAIPLGYDLDTRGSLIPSMRLTLIGMTEAALVQEIFKRVSEGDTTVNICRWLNAANVPAGRRYKTAYQETRGWLPSKLSRIIKNRIYTGEWRYKSKRGMIVGTVPALISSEVYKTAQQALQANKALPRARMRVNLLRGLITCAGCGNTYVAVPTYTRKVYVGHYYKCTNQSGGNKPTVKERCYAKQLKSDVHEDIIWRICKDVITNPAEVLRLARQHYTREFKELNDTERKMLQQQLLDIRTAKKRVTDLHSRGKISLALTDEQLDVLEQEELAVTKTLMVYERKQELARTQEEYLREVEQDIIKGKQEIDKIEEYSCLEQNDPRYIEAQGWKRRWIELLVSHITCITKGEGRQKTYTLRIDMRLGRGMHLGDWQSTREIADIEDSRLVCDDSPESSRSVSHSLKP